MPQRTADRDLTIKELKFIEFYDGNALDAARKAGYKGNDAQLSVVACNIMKRPHIIAAIQNRARTMSGPIIATRIERQAFWTKVMNDGGEMMKNRLKASELLGRSEADFTEKIDLSGTAGLAEKMRKARERRTAR